MCILFWFCLWNSFVILDFPGGSDGKEPLCNAGERKWKSLSRVWLFVTPWTIWSMGFSSQNTGVSRHSFSRGSSQPRVWTQISHTAGGFFTCQAPREALGSIPGSTRSPGEGDGNPLQYSCLENPMVGEAWQAIVQGVGKNWTWLSD